ncbi:MAG: hypothetical protein Q9191_005021 [Dirinaria sp. TL-2023a]
MAETSRCQRLDKMFEFTSALTVKDILKNAQDTAFGAHIGNHDSGSYDTVRSKRCGPLAIPLNVSRTNLPATYISVVGHHGSSVPDDTITYRFSDGLMAFDDVALAVAESYYEATQLLSYEYGNESQPVRAQNVRINGDFYDFDVSSDLYAEVDSFKLWHLRTVVRDLIFMWLEFNMRECTFTYRVEGVVLLQGHLKNGPGLSPPREIAPDPHIDDFSGDLVKFFSYGERISYEATVLAAVDMFNFGWNEMVAHEQSDEDLSLRDQYSYDKTGVRFEMQAAEPGGFLLQYLMHAADAIASFGRTFDMRALKFVLASVNKPKIAGFVVRSGLQAFPNANSTAIQ